MQNKTKHTILAREGLTQRKACRSFIRLAHNSQGNARMYTFSKIETHAMFTSRVASKPAPFRLSSSPRH